MKNQSSLSWLVPLIGLLALAAAGAGLFWPGEGAPYVFTTLHGQTAQIYGQGLYQYDTIFSAAGFKGVDVITLGVALPLLVVAFLLYRRGSLRGGLLLAGMLTYFLYVGASMTFSAAFNRLFLIYVALFSSSLFAFIRAITMIEASALATRIAPHLPHRGLAVFMFVAGLGTLFIWLSDVVGPVLTGGTPAILGPYTTMFTHGFDSAVITPVAVLTGIFILQRKPLGYLLATPILILCTLNGILVIASTISQTLAGIIFPIGVYIGMIGSWVVMGAFAVWLVTVFFRGLSEPIAERLINAQATQAQ